MSDFANLLIFLRFCHNSQRNTTHALCTDSTPLPPPPPLVNKRLYDSGVCEQTTMPGSAQATLTVAQPSQNDSLRVRKIFCAIV